MPDSDPTSSEVVQEVEKWSLPSPQTTPMLSVRRAQQPRDATSESPTAPTRKRRPPTTPASAPEEEEDPLDKLKVLIDVATPEFAPARRGQAQKRSVKRLGPITVLFKTIGYDEFIECLAKEIKCRDELLDRSTLSWKFTAPLGMVPWPLTNKDGYDAMKDEVINHPSKGNTVVVAAERPRDDSRPTTNDGSEPLAKKAKFDDQEQTVRQKLLERYPQGGCTEHLELHCYYYEPTNLHFDLLANARLAVWTAAIIAGHASYDIAPMTKQVFQKTHALKRPSTSEPLPSTSNSVSAPATSTTSTNSGFSDLVQTAQLQLLLNLTGNNHSPNRSQNLLTHNSASYASITVPSSSPPNGEEVTLEKYAEDNRLSQEQVAKLRELGWDSPNELALSLDQKADAVQVGFKPLEWEMVVKRDAKWRKRKHR